MTETITHEGVEYRKVIRKAEDGELVYVSRCKESPEIDFKIGNASRPFKYKHDFSIRVDIPTIEYKDYGFLSGADDEYYVLEPIEPTPVEASPTVIELLANISRRLYEAEQTIKEQAYEINELYKAVAERG